MGIFSKFNTVLPNINGLTQVTDSNTRSEDLPIKIRVFETIVKSMGAYNRLNADASCN